MARPGDELESVAVRARNGYGVLMLDQRGHGRSEGHGMIWGWRGEIDVARRCRTSTIADAGHIQVWRRTRDGSAA